MWELQKKFELIVFVDSFIPRHQFLPSTYEEGQSKLNDGLPPSFIYSKTKIQRYQR